MAIRKWIISVIVVSLLPLLNQFPTASANHENITIAVGQGLHIENNQIPTTVTISTGNFGGHSSGSDEEARYYVVFTDTLAGFPDVPARKEAVTMFVPPNEMKTYTYNRALIEGYWNLNVEVFEDDAQGEKLADYSKTIRVYSGLLPEYYFNQNNSAETWLISSQVSAIVAAITSALLTMLIVARHVRKTSQPDTNIAVENMPILRNRSRLISFRYKIVVMPAFFVFGGFGLYLLSYYVVGVGKEVSYTLGVGLASLYLSYDYYIKRAREGAHVSEITKFLRERIDEQELRIKELEGALKSKDDFKDADYYQ